MTISPSSQSIWVGATQRFTATAKYSDGSTTDVSNTALWALANQSLCALAAGGMVTGDATGSTAVTATFNGMTGTAMLNIGTNVTEWHFDAARDGLNPQEGTLTTANVSAQKFGKLFSYLVDGYVYGQPLLVSDLTVNGAVHDVVFVATENDSVYAFDADSYGSGAPLWKISLLQSGEDPIVHAAILPVLGVTSTPVIDLTSNTMFVVSAQANTGVGTFRLHALDLATGAEKFGGPVLIQATVPGTNSSSVDGVVTLTTSCIQRAALLLADNTIFIGFGSCKSGWLLAYSAQTLVQTGVFNSSPNLDGEGKFASAGGVWMGGGGPVADSNGYIYVSTGNGPYDGLTAFGESVLKFDGQLHLVDHFAPYDYSFMDCRDSDLAAGGLLLIPGSTQVVGGGKTGKLYMVNTMALGGTQPNDAGATQTLWFEPDVSPPYLQVCIDDTNVTLTTQTNSYEIFGTAAYFNGSIYLGVTPTLDGVQGGVRRFTYNGQLTPAEESLPSIQLGSFGTTPFISSNGNTNGIMWMLDHGDPIQGTAGAPPSVATLRAYDATNLTTALYDSGQNTGDAPGYGIKFSSPVVVNGKDYIATAHDLATAPAPQGELDVCGLKP